MPKLEVGVKSPIEHSNRMKMRRPSKGGSCVGLEHIAVASPGLDSGVVEFKVWVVTRLPPHETAHADGLSPVDLDLVNESVGLGKQACRDKRRAFFKCVLCTMYVCV